ncbi:hypothetical protein C8R45DRAFT_934068 [Mycena sanguinolenta]|nr:hypothetical protein C8R45DRAFT_934068 [Mycena sanguinolenta]
MTIEISLLSLWRAIVDASRFALWLMQEAVTPEGTQNVAKAKRQAWELCTAVYKPYTVVNARKVCRNVRLGSENNLYGYGYGLSRTRKPPKVPNSSAGKAENSSLDRARGGSKHFSTGEPAADEEIHSTRYHGANGHFLIKRARSNHTPCPPLEREGRSARGERLGCIGAECCGAWTASTKRGKCALRLRGQHARSAHWACGSEATYEVGSLPCTPSDDTMRPGPHSAAGCALVPIIRILLNGAKQTCAETNALRRAIESGRYAVDGVQRLREACILHRHARGVTTAQSHRQLGLNLGEYHYCTENANIWYFTAAKELKERRNSCPGLYMKEDENLGNLDCIARLRYERIQQTRSADGRGASKRIVTLVTSGHGVGNTSESVTNSNFIPPNPIFARVSDVNCPDYATRSHEKCRSRPKSQPRGHNNGEILVFHGKDVEPIGLDHKRTQMPQR